MDLHFDDNDMSLKRFEKMLKTNSVLFFDSAEFMRIIEYYIDNGKIGLAKKAIELALQQHPNIVGIKVLKAEILIIEDKFPEAQKILEEVEFLEPQNEEIYIQKALLFSKQDKHTEAIYLLEYAMEISEIDEDLDILNLIGMEYLYLEDFKKALEYFKKCLSIEKEDHGVLYNIVYCYDMLGNYDEATQFLLKYIDEYPFNETAWHQLGREYYQQELYNKALNAFDYAILIDEKFIGAYLEKAKTLEQLERYTEAIHYYAYTNQLDDPTAFNYLRIGICYEKMHQTDRAIEFYKKSYEQDPYLDKPLLGIIAILFDKKDYQKALYFINQLINIDDENPVYWKLYAEANMKIAFFEEAVKSYQKCIALKDNSIDNFINLSDSQYFLGELFEAIKTLINAETFYHNFVEIQYRLSGLYFLVKSNDLAIKYLYSAYKNSANKLPIFQKLFPTVYNSKAIQTILQDLKK